MRFYSILRATLAALVVSAASLALVSCTEKDEGLKATAQAPSAESQPGISNAPESGISNALTPGAYEMKIAPVDAYRNTTIELTIKGFNYSDAEEVVWLINGAPTSVLREMYFDSAEIGLDKNDTVQVRAKIGGIEIFSNTITIKNTAPVMKNVKIIPEVFKPGEQVGVSAECTDADKDKPVMSYEWFKNNTPAGTSSRISGTLKRGDEFLVTVRCFDGEAYTPSVTLKRKIGNMPPAITQDKTYVFDNKTFSYNIKAADPDGDKLAYSVRNAPPEMTVDAASGAVKWNVPPDFVGTVEFVVVASDGRGGEAAMNMKFTLAFEKDKKPPQTKPGDKTQPQAKQPQAQPAKPQQPVKPAQPEARQTGTTPPSTEPKKP